MNNTVTRSKTSAPLLSVKTLTVEVDFRKQHRVLSRDVNFDLQPGEILPIIGTSGNGKTTLLKMLVRFVPFSTGEVLFKGNSIRNIPAARLRRRVSYVAQYPILVPGTVMDNLLIPFGFKINCKNVPDEKSLQRFLSGVEFPVDLLDQPIDKLSGGEASRIALLRAMLVDPDILLLDEPTAPLDFKTARSVVKMIKNWSKAGERGVIWIIHDREIIEELGIEPWQLDPDGFHREELPT